MTHHHHHDRETVSFGVVTVSSSRTIDNDEAGTRIIDALESDGHDIVTRELIGDDYDDVQGTVNRLAGREDVDAIVTTGGTGVTEDDVTPDAVVPLFEKDLPGFGELFRQLSYDEIGTRVVGTRAVAGITESVPVFCLPGSASGCELGVTEIVLPEVGHLVGLARRHEDD